MRKENPGKSQPKYDKPLILLMDMGEDVKETLKREGFNIIEGSFGRPYPRTHDRFEPLRATQKFPLRAGEAVIVVVGMEAPPPLSAEEMSGAVFFQPEVSVLQPKAQIDPRPFFAEVAKVKFFDNILYHGGIFVVFAMPPQETGFMYDRDQFSYSTWGFLSRVDHTQLYIEANHREEIEPDPNLNKESPLGRLLCSHTGDAYASCTIERRGNFPKESFYVLARSKYREPLSVLVLSREEAKERSHGCILIFPQIADKPAFLKKLLSDVLPADRPDLFPRYEGLKWVQRPEYELQPIIKLKAEIEQVRSDADKKILDLEARIEKERDDKGYLHDLLIQQGTPLVKAVERTMRDLGFQDVVNIDEELEAAGENGQRREDLQIRDKNPVLVIEVKGVSGTSTDEDALTVEKYLPPLLDEDPSRNYVGLSIINHQRHIPPLDREDKDVFRELVLQNARRRKIGLLTTWDLFRLTRAYLKYGWDHSQVKELFYQSSRIEPIPCHYHNLGVIVEYWQEAGAFGIKTEIEVKVGDRIAFDLPKGYQEDEIISLAINRKPIETAPTGSKLGVETRLTNEYAEKGRRVFLVRP